MIFNKDSFGEILRVNFYRDISAGSKFIMEIQPQFQGSLLTDGTQSEDGRPRKVPATLGTVDVTVDDMKLLANQYVEYTTKKNDFKDVGRWRTKGIVTLPTETIATSYQFFRVMP